MLWLLFNVYTGKLVLFEFMHVQPMDIWRQINRSNMFLLKDLVMKPDTKSLDIFSSRSGDIDFTFSREKNSDVAQNQSYLNIKTQLFKIFFMILRNHEILKFFLRERRT